MDTRKHLFETKFKTYLNEQQDQSYTIEEFPQKIQEFIKQTGLKAESFIKPVPPATSINYKKSTGGYIGLGDMNYFEKFVDIYKNGVGVVNLVNKMIQNK